MPKIKCVICGEEMPEKSYCSSFHKELEMMWDGYQPDNWENVSTVKDQQEQAKTKAKSFQGAYQGLAIQEILPWM